MEFTELQKIWDQQNQQTLYAIDESRLHQQIKRRLSRANRKVNISEIGYILISLMASSILLLIGSGSLYNNIVIASFLLIGVVIAYFRWRRLRLVNNPAMDLKTSVDEALSNQNYLKRAMDSFLLWYILPLAIPAVLNMYHTGGKPLWQWAFVLSSFLLGYLLIRQFALPKVSREIQKLEDLKAMLNS
ncbi:MAG: hypothetical protein AAF433_18560 [Bacteroidota bacterium]